MFNVQIPTEAQEQSLQLVKVRHPRGKIFRFKWPSGSKMLSHLLKSRQWRCSKSLLQHRQSVFIRETYSQSLNTRVILILDTVQDQWELQDNLRHFTPKILRDYRQKHTAKLLRNTHAGFRDADIIEMWLQHELPTAAVTVRTTHQPVRGKNPGTSQNGYCGPLITVWAGRWRTPCAL